MTKSELLLGRPDVFEPQMAKPGIPDGKPKRREIPDISDPMPRRMPLPSPLERPSVTPINPERVPVRVK